MSRFSLPPAFVSAALALGPAPAPATAPAPGPATAAAPAPLTATAPAFAVELQLACGLRVIAARDQSLPVAAVVLAIEVGTEHDPPELPGLVHALAFHLQQGNRELQPGEAIASAHDGGGLHTMAVGAAQVRFESLVPVSLLDRMLWIESQRLRTPTLRPARWQRALAEAKMDPATTGPVPLPAIAAAFGRPGLGHDGHAVGADLHKLSESSLAEQIGRLFDYRRATLVIVSPRDPAAIVDSVVPLFAGLPAAEPMLPEPAPGGPERSAAAIEVPRLSSPALLWAVPEGPAAQAFGRVLCAALNRQLRGPGDGPRSRLSCTFVDDPRRAVLLARTSGTEDPAQLVRERIRRLVEGEDASILVRERDRVRETLRGELHAPLRLARWLARGQPRATAPEKTARPLDALTALDALDDPAGLRAHAPSLLDPSGALLLLPAPEEARK